MQLGSNRYEPIVARRARLDLGLRIVDTHVSRIFASLAYGTATCRRLGRPV